MKLQDSATDSRASNAEAVTEAALQVMEELAAMCFNPPFSRRWHERVRPQLGMIMNRKIKLISAAVGLYLAGLTAPAAAVQLIDQQSTAYAFPAYSFSNSSLPTVPSLGQSFTASLDWIDFARFSLSAYRTSSSWFAPTFRVDLYEGNGFDGSILGSSPPRPVSSGSGLDGTGPIEFDFASPIVLTPGDRYTLRLINVTAPPFLSLNVSASSSYPFASGGPYAGGTMFQGPLALADSDMVFAEGYTTAAVPAPSASALMLVGMGIVGFASKRRKEQYVIPT